MKDTPPALLGSHDEDSEMVSQQQVRRQGPCSSQETVLHTSRWVDTRIATEAWPLISCTGLISWPAALSQSEAETKRSLSILGCCHARYLN